MGRTPTRLEKVMLSNNNSHRIKVETKKVMRLKEKALEWEEWHGTWLESSINEFFDMYSIKFIKSEILGFILEDEADPAHIKYLMFHEKFKDFLKNKSTPAFYKDQSVPTPAIIDTMFELDIPIIEEMYETFCKHYGI